MKRSLLIYYLFIFIGLIGMICLGYFGQQVILALCLYVFVYRPIIDYIFIKKRNLYSGRNLICKYPFWGFKRKLYHS